MIEDDKALNEFLQYLNAESKANLAVGTKLWNSIISFHTGTPQLYSLAGAYAQHEAAILEKTYDGRFRPYAPQLKAIGVACGDYDVAFDGQSFKTCTHKREGFDDFYTVDSPNKYLLVWKDTRLLQCAHLLDVINQNVPKVNTTYKTRLVEGVPGCGKTTEIINRAGPKDLILTVARRTKEEIREKLKKKQSHTSVRTVDSYLLNDRARYDKVFLDEGLMIHAGQVNLIANYTNCKELLIFGDRNQLNFTCRVADFEVRHHILKTFKINDYYLS